MTLLSVAIAASMAVVEGANESFAGGGGGKSGITQECDQAVCRVSMTALTFAPDTLKIRPGATVVWANSDKIPHTVTSGRLTYERGAVFDSGLSSPIIGGVDWNHTFGSAGIFDYFCAFHPRMTAQVIVTGEPIEEISRLTYMIVIGAGILGAFGVAAAIRLRH